MISSTSRKALGLFVLLLISGGIGFCMGEMESFGKRPTYGGSSLKLYPLKFSMPATNPAGKNSQQWIKGYDVYFGQMSEVSGTNVWGFVFLSPTHSTDGPPPTQDPKPDTELEFSIGNTTLPIFVTEPILTGASRPPIVIPIDSMSSSKWSESDVMKMSLAF